MDLVYKIESVLFASGDKVPLSHIVRLTRAPEKDVLEALEELQTIYNSRETSLVIFKEEDNYKLSVKEKYLPIVRKIVNRTELAKSVMETLAVIAWKAPMKQSVLIDIRSNKAYDHIKELEKADFISREPSGRTFIVKLTQKFFDYFELSERDIDKKFEKFEDLEKAMVPQLHVTDFEPKKTPEQIQEEKGRELEEQNVQLASEVKTQETEDVDFLSEIDKRIEKVGAESENTKKTFDDLMPSIEESEDNQEASEEENEGSEPIEEVNSTPDEIEEEIVKNE